MVESWRLRRAALGLYMILSIRARRLYGRSVEELSLEEFRRLLSETVPGRERLVERVLGPPRGVLVLECVAEA